MIDAIGASEDALSMEVTWADGRRSRLSAETLRREAQDARSRRERVENGAIYVRAGTTITGIHDMGYGVNVQFSDGHDKAIYPTPYLRELCDRFDK